MKITRYMKLVGIVALLFCSTILFSPVTPAEDGGENLPSTYDLKVITYNVAGLPDLFTYDRNLAPMDKRFDYIGKQLRKYDIVGLQEVFISKRSIIEAHLSDYFLAHGTDTGMSNRFGSGVYTFVRWTIRKLYYERWRKSEGPDSLSHKGFVMVTTKVSDELLVDVYNLHGQAGGENNFGVDNMHQLVDAMKLMSLGQGRPILLIGDFNCRFGDEQCTVFVETSGVTTVFPEQKGVDHAFYHENDSGWKISVVEYRKVFDELMGGRLVSDHEGFETIFRLEKK